MKTKDELVKKKEKTKRKAGRKDVPKKNIDAKREVRLKKKREAESKRRLKIRLNKKKHEEYKQKERERWRKRVLDGKVKTVAEITDKEKRIRRKNTLNAVRAYRQRMKEVKSDIISNDEVVIDFTELTNSTTLANVKSGKRCVARDRAKCYRENQKLKEENKKLQKLYECYKKRAQRKEKKLKAPLSPKSSFQNIVKGKKLWKK